MYRGALPKLFHRATFFNNPNSMSPEITVSQASISKPQTQTIRTMMGRAKGFQSGCGAVLMMMIMMMMMMMMMMHFSKCICHRQGHVPMRNQGKGIKKAHREYAHAWAAECCARKGSSKG